MTWEFSCGHRFCLECTREDMKIKIKNNDVDKLMCLQNECGAKVNVLELSKLFEQEPETLKKLRDFIEKQSKEGDPLMRWCTKPGCSGLMKGETLDSKKVTCPVCSTEVCFQCRDEWHGSVSCEANMDSKLEGWVDKHGGVRFCPVCKTKVEKNEGCNHMTCIICSYEFCWHCFGYCGHDANHFTPTSRYYCGATQFGDGVTQGWLICGYFKYFLLFLLAVVLAPIAYVLYFVIGGAVVGVEFANRTNRSRRGCHKFFAVIGGIAFGMTGGVVVGTLLSPFALLFYVGAILFCIGYATWFICRRIKDSVVARCSRSRRGARGPEE